MNVFSNTNREYVKQKATEELSSLFKEYQETSILFLSSGGSALELLEGLDKNLLGPHITISVLDERFDKDPKINNFAQLMLTMFYKDALKAGVNFIDTRVEENEDIDTLAVRFESDLREWIGQGKDGVILVTQGLGLDGHTSGVMPYPEDNEKFLSLFESDNTHAVGYNAGVKNQYPLRVTTTNTFLRDYVDHSIFYVPTDDKKEALRKTMDKKSKLSEIPARIIHQMSDVRVFTTISLG